MLALPAPRAYSARVNRNPETGPHFLVIGYGNTLRSDDGVGLKVAAAVELAGLPGVRALACHQLTPELAEPVAQARAVVFVDAAVGAPAGIQVVELAPAAAGQILAHVSDPKTLLALARDLFGRCPPAWWVTIPIQNTDFGEELSPLAREGMQSALEKIRALAAGQLPR